jgi:hypothetical protein
VIKDVKYIVQKFSNQWCGSKERNSQHIFDKVRDVTCHIIWDSTHPKTVTTLFNKFLIFCFNLPVSHPYLLHCHLLESVCEMNNYK